MQYLQNRLNTHVRVSVSTKRNSLPAVQDNKKILSCQRIEKSTDLSKFLRAFYNANVFFLISPATFYSYEEENSKYVYKTAPKICRVLIGIIQVWAVFTFFLFELYISRNSAWNVWVRSESVDTQNLFLFTFNALEGLTLFNLYHTLRNQSQGFSNILNKVRDISQSLDDVGANSPNLKFVKILSIGVVALIPLWMLFTRLYIVNQLHTKSFEELFGDQVCGILIQNCSTTRDHPLPLGYSFLGGFIFVSSSIASMAVHASLVTPFVHAITFYIIHRGFMNFLKVAEYKQQSLEQRHQALKIFEEICGLSELLDDVVGPVIAFACLDILTYFSTLLNAILTFNLVAFIEVFVYASVLGSFLVLAAETNTKLGYLSFWLQNGLKDFASDDPTLTSAKDKWNLNQRIWLALHQLQRNQVGIRGRVFTVSYGFIGSMLSLLLSYSILFSQLKTRP